MKVYFRADQAPAFLATWESDGLEAAQRKHGVDQAEEGRPTVRDPRGFGYSGAYPRIGRRHNPRLLDRLQEEVGAYAAIVEEWASQTFAEGWTIQSEKDPKWAEKVNERLLELDVPGLLEDADANVLVHGKGVLLFRLNDVQQPTDLAQTPRSGVEVEEIISVEIPNIAKAHARKNPKRGEDLLEGLDVVLRGKQTVRVHGQRVLVLRERPVLDDPFEGKPRLKRCVDSTVLYENTKWWAGESFARRASPLVQAVIDPDAKLKPAEREAIVKKLQGLIEGTTQTAVVKDYKFETVAGYSAIVNPQTQWTMAVDSLSLDSRIPKHRLIGAAAGDGLSSAMADEKRFLGRVSRRQERYGTRGIKAIVKRLAELDDIPEPPEDWTVAWEPLDEPTILERATAWEATGKALVQLRAAGVPFPAELVQYVAAAPPKDPAGAEEPDEEEVEEEPEPEKRTPPEGEDDHAHHASDAPPPEHPDLKAVRLNGQQEILAAYAAWSRRYGRILQGQDAPAGPDNPIVKRLLAVKLDGRNLGRAITNLLEEAGLVGGASELRNLNRGAGGFDFQDDTPTRVFKTLGDTLGEQKAAELTTRIKSSIAQGVAAGEGIPQLKARVMAEFDVAPTAAETIARTEAMRGYNYGHREALRQIGAQEYQLSIFGDACPTCTPLQGQRFPIGDAAHIPPLHPRCRCVPVQVSPP